MALFARPHGLCRDALGAEQEALQPRFLQPVELRDHRCPLPVYEGSQQPVQLHQVLADVGP